MDRGAGVEGGADLCGVAGVGVARVARAERDHRPGVVGEDPPHRVDPGGLPLAFGCHAAEGGDALAQARDAPADLAVVGVGDRVEVREGAPEPGGDAPPDGRLARRGRAHEDEQRCGFHGGP